MLRNFSFPNRAIVVLLSLILVPFQEANLQALPPLDIGVLDAGTVEVSWPDTDEEVQLESSDRLGNWQLEPGAPVFSDGKFRKPVAIDSEEEYFRLAGAEVEPVDPAAPTFNLTPQIDPSFPGESVRFTLSATDPNGLLVTYLAERLPLPAGASLNRETGEFAWVPSLSQVGNTTITFLAFNGTSSGRLPLTLTVLAPPAGGETSLAGILLDTTNAVNGELQPISGAVVSLLGTPSTAVTGVDGQFLLDGIPGGKQVLDIATETAAVAPDGSRYAGFREAIGIIPGIRNDVERPFYLPRIAMHSLAEVNPNFTTKVENVDLGTSIVVAPHTATKDGEEFTGELSISDVPEALAPAALPENLGFGQLVTIQPVGVRFTRPVPITFKNVDQLPPGSETDIWSLDPDAGVFTVVGTGRVTADGEFIETIAGGVIAADWHGTLPPALPPVGGSPPPPVPQNGDDPPPDCPSSSNAGASAPFGSTVLLADGAVLISMELPAYQSGGERRAIGIGYHSITAYPRILAPIEATIPVLSAVPRQVSFSGSLGGLSGGRPVFFDTSGLDESSDETFVGGLAFDASGLPTGFAPYRITATNHYLLSTVSAQTVDRAVVVNRSKSAYGAGWGILGDQRIVSAEGNAREKLIVGGDGSFQLFRHAATFAPFTIAALGGSRAGVYSFADGSLFTQARAAIAGSFPNAAFDAVETLAEASDTDLIVLSPYANPAEGVALTALDQAALVSFIRNGGCALVFLDHDLNRASFAQATASLLAPFGLSGQNVRDSGGAVVPVSHPLIAEEFGELTRLDMPFGGFEIDASGTQLEVIVPGERAGSARLALLPKDALGDGSGPVILVADTQAFADLADVGFDSAPAHATLLLSAVDFCLRSQRDLEADVEYRGPAGDFSRLIEEADGGFERRMPDGTSHRFNASGHLTQTRGRDGETFTFRHDRAGNLTT